MARKKVVNQYMGSLTPKQAADGIAAAMRNAESLLRDAELLLEHGRWPRATALTILAIEESGKVPLLRALLLAKNEAERREEWKAYRSHTEKNVLYILPQLVAEGARSLEDMRPVMDPESEHPEVLDAVKQYGFYTDACGNCHWSIPDEVISEAFAKSMFRLASLLAKGSEALTSAEELEIWVKHMGPVWKHEKWEMDQALAACYAEAEERGLLRGHASAREMTKFIYGTE